MAREKYWTQPNEPPPQPPTNPQDIAENAGVPIDEILRQTPVFDQLLEDTNEDHAQPV